MPGPVLAQRFEERLDQIWFDQGLPLADPGVVLLIAFIVVRERGFQAESKGKGFFFLVHRTPQPIDRLRSGRPDPIIALNKEYNPCLSSNMSAGNAIIGSSCWCMAQRTSSAQSAKPRSWRSKSPHLASAAQMPGCCQAKGEAPAEVAVTRAAPVPVPRIDHGVRRARSAACDSHDLSVRPSHQIARSGKTWADETHRRRAACRDRFVDGHLSKGY